MKAGVIWEISVLFVPFCYELKVLLKIKSWEKMIQNFPSPWPTSPKVLDISAIHCLSGTIPGAEDTP